MAEAQFGLLSGVAVGKHVKDILGDSLFAAAKPYIDRALAGEPQVQETVEPLKDGSHRYTQVRYVPERRAEEVVGLYARRTDISELRLFYERIRDLAQRFDAVREEERRSIAQSLHEGIAQDLFALRLDHVKAQATGRTGVTEACQQITAATEKCMSDTRQIASDLRPSAFAHLWVAAAIEELLRMISNKCFPEN